MNTSATRESRRKPKLSGLVKGWPRPFARFTETLATKDPAAVEAYKQEYNIPDELPVSFINSKEIEKQNWLSFDEDAIKAIEAAGYKLCSVCGEKLGRDKFFGVMHGGDGHVAGEGILVSGNGMHAKCALLAVRFCPHLSAKKFPVAHFHGNGPGIDFKRSEDMQKPNGDESKVDLSEFYADPRSELITVDQVKALV